jgi:adenylate kinase family enzyme
MMKKVIVIGCAGSGKSVFSRSFAQISGLPLYHLDTIWWREDGTNVSREEFDLRLGEILERDEWIIDGNYKRTMEWRIEACDTVIFFDLPLEVCIDGIKERKGKDRPDMPWKGAGDCDDPEFMEFVYNFNSINRPAICELIEKYSYKNIIVFKSRAESEEFLDTFER